MLPPRLKSLKHPRNDRVRTDLAAILEIALGRADLVSTFQLGVPSAVYSARQQALLVASVVKSSPTSLVSIIRIRHARIISPRSFSSAQASGV